MTTIADTLWSLPAVWTNTSIC